MPAHFRPPERRIAHPIGVLAIAVGISLLVIATFSSRPGEEGTTRLVQPATESSEATVLGEVVERTTVPEAPPASATGFTTSTEGSSDGGGGTTRGTVAPTSPSPTLAPPVSVINTTTTRPTTTTTAPTTTTESTTTTTAEPAP